MLKVNDKERLTRQELEDYKSNSGITEIQFKIIKMRFFDIDESDVLRICTDLNISKKKYYKELNKALNQIRRYTLK